MCNGAEFIWVADLGTQYTEGLRISGVTGRNVTLAIAAVARYFCRDINYVISAKPFDVIIIL